jgi:hypothetical protein
MKKLFELLTIDKEFIFLGKRKELNEILKNSKDLNHRTYSENEIEFTPTISWGTLNVGGIGLGIYIKASVRDFDSDRLKIRIKTSLRPEHYFTVALFAFFFVSTISSNESNWIILYIFGLWIVCHAWFQFTCRLQENYLVDRVVRRLKLLEM